MTDPLDVFVQPKSIAVIGATERPGAWGSFIMDSLLTCRFPGRIYPVNHRSSEVCGLTAYPDIQSIPDVVDLAVMTIPEDNTEETIRACGLKGVRGITIITAGFGEAVEGGKQREASMAETAHRYGMRLLGPNVSGTFNLHAGFNASGSPAQLLVPSPLAAVCQGGYALYELLAKGYFRGMGVGKFIHTGNECDLQVVDFLERFGKDDEVKGILMYLETVRNGKRFMDAARWVSREKPIVVHKVGRTAGGSRAARSHTGAIAGHGGLYQGALEQAGVILSPSMELLLPLGHALIERPPMRGKNVAIVTMGGSWGVALCDRIEEENLIVPEFSPHLQARLRDMGMPPRASTRNPLDIGAAGPLALSVETLAAMAKEILSSGEVDALVLHGFGRAGLVGGEVPPYRRMFLDFEKKVMREYNALQGEFDKPVVIGCCQSPLESQAVSDLIGEGMRIEQRLDEIAQILHGLYRYWRRH